MGGGNPPGTNWGPPEPPGAPGSIRGPPGGIRGHPTSPNSRFTAYCPLSVSTCFLITAVFLSKNGPGGAPGGPRGRNKR